MRLDVRFFLLDVEVGYYLEDRCWEVVLERTTCRLIRLAMDTFFRPTCLDLSFSYLRTILELGENGSRCCTLQKTPFGGSQPLLIREGGNTMARILMGALMTSRRVRQGKSPLDAPMAGVSAVREELGREEPVGQGQKDDGNEKGEVI